MKRCVLAVLVAGCASGSNAAQSDAPFGGQDAHDDGINEIPDAPPDAAPHPDAPPDAAMHPDAPPIDAPPPIDAAPPIDAPIDACVPITTEILANPVFDLSPVGRDWVAQPIDAAYPLITSDGPAPQSAPYKAWMGGLSGDDIGGTSATDQLYQDVVVPMGTTQLVLTGYYLAGTNEDPNDAVYDTATVDLLQTNGTPIENALALSNLTTASSYTLFSHTFTANLSGQTVRLRLTSTNDIINATGWVFDTLSLKATHCP